MAEKKSDFVNLFSGTVNVCTAGKSYMHPPPHFIFLNEEESYWQQMNIHMIHAKQSCGMALLILPRD